MHETDGPTAAVLRDALRELDDEAIAATVRRGALPPLLAALAQLSGDLSILRDDLRPDPARVMEPHGGLSTQQRAMAADAATEMLYRLRDGVAEPPPTGTDGLRELMDFALGAPVTDEYLDMLLEELAVEGRDRRAPTWHKDEIAPEREFLAVIIGAGMSGLAAGHRLAQAGVPFVIIEKNAEVGGTWCENQYPGCRVDVPNHLYSYSFAQRDDWPDHFTPQETLLAYFRDCAEELGLTDHLRLGTEVMTATYREDRGDWAVEVRGPDGATETIEANVVVSAVGQLNRPRLPDIPGRKRFTGPSFHSARWEPDVDLAGQRVAVVGTGASGIQIIPAIADRAGEVLVFQRTPNWLVPTPLYYRPVSEQSQWLLRHVPFYSEWYRLWLFWRLCEGALPAAKVDADWQGDPRAVGALNDGMRQLLTTYLEAQFADAPDLLADVVPQYPPLAKRMLLDDGTWARTVGRDDVHLVSDAIAEITSDAIVTDDGVSHPVDVIVWATGFEASRFLMPMKVVGRDGDDLHETWDGDARAYLGITVPRFPNLFCLYGPNTNLVANGSIIFFSECEVQYLLESVHLLLAEGHRALDCRDDVWRAYNERIDAGNLRTAWGVASVNSWYKNAAGRVTQNWPFSLLEFWEQTRAPDPADYELL